MYSPTWEPCENANEALRADYESKTDKKEVRGPEYAERAPPADSLEQTATQNASDETLDIHRTDWFSLYVDDANAHNYRAAARNLRTPHNLDLRPKRSKGTKRHMSGRPLLHH